MICRQEAASYVEVNRLTKAAYDADISRMRVEKKKSGSAAVRKLTSQPKANETIDLCWSEKSLQHRSWFPLEIARGGGTTLGGITRYRCITSFPANNSIIYSAIRGCPPYSSYLFFFSAFFSGFFDFSIFFDFFYFGFSCIYHFKLLLGPISYKLVNRYGCTSTNTRGFTFERSLMRTNRSPQWNYRLRLSTLLFTHLK